MSQMSQMSPETARCESTIEGIDDCIECTIDDCIECTIHDCIMADEPAGAVRRRRDSELEMRKAPRSRPRPQLDQHPAITVHTRDTQNWRVRQPLNGDPVFEVTCGPITFYLSGIHEQAPRAATAFAPSHAGPLLDEPHDIVAERLHQVKAIVTSMARTIIRPRRGTKRHAREKPAESLPLDLPERPEKPEAMPLDLPPLLLLDLAPVPLQCLTERLAHASARSHATMTFDPDDLAAKLRLIADGRAPEYVSYLALCSS